MDNELILFDRIEIIKTTLKDKLDKCYLSFSGGKDSTILHYLLDMALPDNKIPRVYIDTGIEYNDIRNFVKELAKNDDRFIILKPTQSIKKVLETYGYPFKSKEHSTFVRVYQNNGLTKSVKDYLKLQGHKMITCPNCLKYQFTEDFSLKISDKCCFKLKKEPIRKWEKENNKTISILGLRQYEGGQRASHKGCVVYDKEKNIVKFKPLNPITDEWEEWFINKYNIKLCRLYYPPFNFKRTGCKGCPFSLDLQSQLDTMEKLLPSEYKQCELIWKPVYSEYRRLNYRIKNEH